MVWNVQKSSLEKNSGRNCVNRPQINQIEFWFINKEVSLIIVILVKMYRDAQLLHF